MVERIKNNIDLHQEEEKPLVEFPALIKFGIILLSFGVGLSFLILPWYFPLILFLGFCFFVGIIFSPFLGIILFLSSSYLHPLAAASAEFVQYQPATIAAFFILFAWGFHVIVYRDFKLPKTIQLFFWFSFLIISIFSAVLHWNESRYAFLELLKVLLLYFLVLNLVKTRKQFLVVLFLILILTFISATFGIKQQIQGVGEHVSEEMVRAESFEGNPNYFSMNLVLLIPLIFGLFQNQRSLMLKGALIILLLIFITSVTFTFSRAGVIGLVVVLFLSARTFLVKRNQLTALIVFVLIFSILLPYLPEAYWERVKSITNMADFSILGRVDGFFVGSMIMLDHPFLGVGMGRWRLEYWPIAFSSPHIRTKISTTSHNVFIEIGAEMGMIALLFFILLLFNAFKDLKIARSIFNRKGDSLFAVISQSLEIGLLGFLVCALFAAAVYLKIFWILLGLTVVLKEIAFQTESEGE